MGTWKYFTDFEVIGLKDNLPAMLDMARGIAGVPFILTSTVDGKHAPNSAHYKGLAVDIGLGHLSAGAIRDGARALILKGLVKAGFERIEICHLHFHVDIGTAPDYITPLCWLGEDT